jgi:hypothetical protein
MRRLLVLPSLTLALAVSACLDTTEPTPVVEGRVAHAIPGPGPSVVVALNFAPIVELQPLAHAFFPVSGTHHNYDFFLGADTLSLQVLHARDITAVILMELQQPTVRAFSYDRNGFNQRLAIINGQHEAGNLEIVVEAADTTFTLELPPGEAERIDPPTGTFQLRVAGQDDEEHHVVNPFSLQPGDHGFLVLMRGPGPEQPYSRLLF